MGRSPGKAQRPEGNGAVMERGSPRQLRFEPVGMPAIGLFH
jgi:hypothetical protein